VFDVWAILVMGCLLVLRFGGVCGGGRGGFVRCAHGVVWDWLFIGMECGYFVVFWPQRCVCVGGLRGGEGLSALRRKDTVSYLVG